MGESEPQEFVDDWNIIQTLGEGAYGEVKLLANRKDGSTVAVKIVDLQKHSDAKASVRREVGIHRLLRHPNIIRFLGTRQETYVEYLFLEYAVGGELYDKIEPDVGMSPYHAQNYIKQLLTAVEYLHGKGVCHRDIKPENILIDQLGNLKLIDFGMATIFEMKGKERTLDKKCGTLSYVAPEVLECRYHARPADIWSCGVVLVAMLSGELPWTEPRHSCPDYVKWVECSKNYLQCLPWCKFDTTLLSLAKKILCPVPEKRATMKQILHHPWMKLCFTPTVATYQSDADPPQQRTPRNEPDSEPLVALSQPLPIGPPKMDGLLDLVQPRDNICFSQPTQNDELILNLTQTRIMESNFHVLIKRMTRFFVTTTCEKTIEELGAVLNKLRYTWTVSAGVVTISTVDAGRNPLTFKAMLIEMDNKLLVDFRLSKGCGLEFKRRFMQLKKALATIVA